MTDQSLQNQQRTRWLIAAGVAAIVGVIALVMILPPLFADALMIGAVVFALAMGARALRRSRWGSLDLPYSRLFVILAFLLVAIAAVFFTPTDSVAPITPAVERGVLATIAATVMLSFALIGRKLVATSVIPADDSVPAVDVRVFASWWHKLTTFGGGLILLFVAEASANLLHVSWLRYTPSHHQFVLLVVGIALVTWGLGARHTRRAHPLFVLLWEVLVVGLVSAVALFIRIWELDTRLLTLVDELNFMSHVMHFWQFDDNPLVHPMTGVVPFTRVFSYWESWTVALFGRDFAGIRAASAVIGTANVVAVWWLARHLFNRQVAILAAILLATFPMHIHFSRVALNNIVDPLFGTLALAFLARGLQSRSRWDFALAGAFLGMVPYFYEAGRLIFPIIVVVWLVFAVWIGRRRLDAPLRWSLVAMGGIAALVAMPVYYNTLFVTRNVAGRLSFVSLGPEYWERVLSGQAEIGGFIDNVARSFLLYVNRWETFIHYGGIQPLVLTIFVPLFLLGVIYALHETLRRSAGAALILMWFVLVGLGNSVLADPAVTTRHVVTMPAVAILLALGVYETVRLLVESNTLTRAVNPVEDADDQQKDTVARFARQFPFAVAVILALIIGVRQVDYYFNEHMPMLEVQIRFLNPYRDVTDALLRAAELEPGTHVTIITEYVYSGRDTHDFLNYVADDLTISTLQNGFIPDDYFETLDLARPQAVFIAPENEDTLDALRLLYGNDLPPPQETTNSNVPPQERFDLYTFPPGAYSVTQPPDPPSDIAYNASLLRFYGTLLLLGVVGFGARVAWRQRPAQFPRLRLPHIDIGTFPHDPRLARVAFILAMILLALAIFALSPSRLGSAGMGAIFAVLSGLALGVSLLARPLSVDDADTITRASAPFRLHINRLILGILVLVPLVVINASQLDDNGIHIWAQAILLVSGFVLISNAFGQGYRLTGIGRTLRDNRFDLLALVAILVLATFVRVHHLEYAVHRFIDEMHSVEAVNNLNDNPYTALLSQHGTLTAFTWFYPLMQTVSVDFYGPSLTGLRVVSVVFGVLTIPAVWWLARLHFDRRTALFAALLLATFPPHVHFSRIGLNNIVDPLLAVLSLVFITRGMRTGNDRDFALAGMWLGLTQYFYEGGRLLYTPLIAVFVALYVLRGARHWRGIAIGALVFVLVAAPVYLTWDSYRYDNSPRLTAKVDENNFYAVAREDGISAGIERFVETVYRPAWMLVQHPDEGWFYGGDRALILPLILPLFLLGVFYALFQARKVALGLLVVWVLAALVGNALLVDRMDSPRYVVIFPALVLLVAVGLRYTLAHLNVRRTGVVMLVAGLVIAVWQTVYYFDRHLPRFNDQYLSTTVFDDVLFRLATLPSNTQAYIITNQAGLAFQDVAIMLRFHNRQDDIQVIPYERDAFIEDSPLETLPEGRRLAFFIQARDRTTRALLDAHFDSPQVHRSPYDGLPPDQQFLLIYVVN